MKFHTHVVCKVSLYYAAERGARENFLELCVCGKGLIETTTTEKALRGRLCVCTWTMDP